jgi:hypothetical protein
MGNSSSRSNELPFTAFRKDDLYKKVANNIKEEYYASMYDNNLEKEYWIIIQDREKRNELERYPIRDNGKISFFVSIDSKYLKIEKKIINNNYR